LSFAETAWRNDREVIDHSKLFGNRSGRAELEYGHLRREDL
jgi:hypothetical protein